MSARKVRHVDFMDLSGKPKRQVTLQDIHVNSAGFLLVKILLGQHIHPHLGDSDAVKVYRYVLE
jgi:hypothetical protein